MDIKHEMREALMEYAAKATGETRETVEKSISPEDELDLSEMIDIVSEVAERYAIELVNKTTAELI